MVRLAGLSESEQAAQAAITLRGPDPERDGISAYTREDLARIIQNRFGRHYHLSSLSGVLRWMGFSRQINPAQPSPLQPGRPDAVRRHDPPAGATDGR